MADNQNVYQAIKTIADELCKENKTYLRADLAFELKKYGIASDSSEVSKRHSRNLVGNNLVRGRTICCFAAWKRITCRCWQALYCRQRY